MASTSEVFLNIMSPSYTQQEGHIGIVFYDESGAVVDYEEQDVTIPEEGGTVSFTVSKDVSSAVTMDVYIDEYMLVVNGGNGTGHYPAGASVTVFADSTNEWYFSMWTGTNGLDVLYGDDSSSTLMFTMPNREVSLTAKYRPSIDIPEMGTPDFVLPSIITEIEEEAFEGISATTVSVPETCQSIGKYAFRNSAVTQILIPENCELGEDVFDGCEYVYIYGISGSSAEEYCSEHGNCLFVTAS